MTTFDPDELTGKRIKLISMSDDDPCPMDPGATGTVDSVVRFQDSWHLNMDWDEEVGRSLNLILPHDKIEII